MRTAGIDIGGTNIKLGVFEDDLCIYQTSVKSPHDDPAATCALIAGMLEPLNVQRAGVGTAGSVDFRTGVVSASNLGWTDVPLQQMLNDALGVPVWIENDAQAAIAAEWRNGACKDAQCAVYLTLGTGIGGAMIVDGKPYRGHHHLGAEFGHMIIHPNGLHCTCGRRGCLECYASASALQRLANGQSAHAVVTRARSGDARCLSLFRRYVRELCLGLSNLIMIFDPQMIVLGGGLSCAGAFLAEACQRQLAVMFSATSDPLLCKVRTAHHKNDAGILGAAWLAKENLPLDE